MDTAAFYLPMGRVLRYLQPRCNKGLSGREHIRRQIGGFHRLYDLLESGVVVVRIHQVRGHVAVVTWQMPSSCGPEWSNNSCCLSGATVAIDITLDVGEGHVAIFRDLQQLERRQERKREGGVA